VYFSDANVQGIMGGAHLCYLFSCGKSRGLPFTSAMSSHPPFCSRFSATASVLATAVSMTTEYAAVATQGRRFTISMTTRAIAAAVKAARVMELIPSWPLARSLPRDLLKGRLPFCAFLEMISS
jgi:hypothetical protein